MKLPPYVIRRGKVLQYVRRIPGDVAHAFPVIRIQRTLATVNVSEAYAAAGRITTELDAQFAGIRRERGFTIGVIHVDSWTWPDWEQLADWFKATLVEDDLKSLIMGRRGRALAAGAAQTVDLQAEHPDALDLSQHDHRLKEMTVGEYAAERVAFVQSVVRRLGIPISQANPYFARFMAAALAAEIGFLDIALRYRMGQKVGYCHPDTIAGPWKAAIADKAEQQVAKIVGPANVSHRAVGKSLNDCRAAYAAERIRANKPATLKQLNDMDITIGRFQSHSGIKDVGLVQRSHIIAFRDQLYDGGDYATASVNKRTGYITTLVKTAANKGWIDQAIRGDIRLTVPEGEDAREPYSTDDLALIFGHPMFTERKITSGTAAASLGVLPFWLPLISCLHGMISSEILQLGPDTVRIHPDTDIWCFAVTTSGGRHIKTEARRRWMPIRHEMIDLGLLDLVKEAEAQGWKTLWQPVEAKHGDIDAVSQQVSAFWADFARKDLKITDPQKTLYSFRHSFKDAIGALGASDDEKKQLLGHAETGATKGYGTKKAPRPVDIKRLDEIVQAVSWPFLAGL
ncbi:DUF6538 domain-containing protein [Devosia sp.]|uniref:DUF6538 domain-containing protein n=1 Tax=Devosia sp. TaxID=1871048 RepID=UPI003267390D